jgi:anti-sigma factor RsiW
MRCRIIQKKMPQYVQGLLSADDACETADHMQACAACREELKGLQKAWNALGELPAPLAAASMAPAVLQRIGDYESRREGTLRAWLSPFRLSFAGAAAAIMLACFASGALISSVYYPDNSQAHTDTGSVYAEILSDAPPVSFVELYQQNATQNTEENS